MNNNINIALFIDYENLGHNKENIDISIVVKELKKRGRVIYKRAYGDWARFYKDRRAMLKNSIDLIEMPTHGHGKKNSADIKLVVDALETAITKKHIDTIAILSGDSDFTPLISKLREYDKYVISIGRDKRTTSYLIEEYCDELVYYSDLMAEKAVPEEVINLGFELMIKAIQAFPAPEVYSFHLKKKMIELDSSFDETQLGFSKFNAFLEAAEVKGIVKLKKASQKGGYLVQSLLLSQEKTAEQIRSKEEENKGSDKLITILDDLYWSIYITDPTLKNPTSLNEISNNLRAFIPNFRTANYGIPKHQGLKFLLEEIQKLGYVRLSFEGKMHYLKARKKLIEYGKALEKPALFDQILGERCIKIYRLAHRLSDLMEGQLILQSTLALLENTDISIIDLYQKYLESVKELNAKISARRTFYTFLQTNNLVTERGKEALNLDGEHLLNIKTFIVLDEEEYNAFFEKNLKEIALKEGIDYEILLKIYRKTNDIHQEKEEEQTRVESQEAKEL